MNYDKNALVFDFARRTKKNLEFVESYVHSQPPGSNPEVYEVTQLINSLLGLLVFPREKFYTNKKLDIPLSQLQVEGWPDIKVIEGKLKEDTLQELLRYLRNGVSHFNIEFTMNHDGNLSGIRVWNIPEHSKICDWKAELKLEELKLIVYKFIELIEDMMSK